MINNGKRFEENFKKSVPPDVFYYRFKDGTSSWDGGDLTRFQASNICDCMLYTKNRLFLLELKNHKGKSIPFSCIRQNQLTELVKAHKFNIISGFIFNFQDIEETYFVHSNLVNEYIESQERKSFPYMWCEEVGIRIRGKKLKTNYRYDLAELLA